MTVLWVSAGILVVLAVLGYLNMRQRRKREMLTWDSGSERLQSRGDSESRYPRPQYGSFPYSGGGGGGDGGGGGGGGGGGDG
ncbi:hypothetical protein ABN028_31165 [Actinopolymorpha sp. B17G11]|uniref:hypothetical protein n=1 Tax=unclassified Actinopolymorpha TaxID=2627063 RepID=UPI0032D92660